MTINFKDLGFLIQWNSKFLMLYVMATKNKIRQAKFIFICTESIYYKLKSDLWIINANYLMLDPIVIRYVCGFALGNRRKENQLEVRKVEEDEGKVVKVRCPM